MKRALKIIGWIFAVLVLLLVIQIVRAGRSAPRSPEISYSEFVTRVSSGQVSKTVITCNLVQAYDAGGGRFLVTAPPNQTAMLESLRQHGVEIWFRDAPTWPNWILYLIPMLLLVAILFIVLRQGRRIRRLEEARS